MTEAVTEAQRQADIRWLRQSADDCGNAAEAILHGFVWMSTPQGQGYWSEVHTNLVGVRDAKLKEAADLEARHD